MADPWVMALQAVFGHAMYYFPGLKVVMSDNRSPQLELLKVKKKHNMSVDLWTYTKNKVSSLWDAVEAFLRLLRSEE